MLVAAVTAVAVEASGVSARIPAGVRVDGVAVGGLTPGQASRRLELHARDRARRRVVVEGPLRAVETSGAALGGSARIDEVLAATSAGRVGLVRHWLGWRHERELSLNFDVPAARVEALTRQLGCAPAVNARIEVDGDGIRVVPGRNGYVADLGALRGALAALPPRVRVATVATPPRVTTRAAEAAAERARRLAQRPRTIRVGTASHTLAPPDLLRALTIRREEQGFAIGFDPARIQRALPATTAPRNAVLKVQGSRVQLVPSAPGRTIDAAATALALADPTRTTVVAAVKLQPASVTTADLTALAIRERVSAFTTSYPPGQPRVVNIRRAAAVIDGTIMRPGETFSMNGVLGERTIAKGYVAAPQIVGSSFADSVGGGISQVATMLYNGAFFAGLELVEHQPHSLYIDRYPLGREATISWGGPELIFRNDWPAAVLIDLKASDSAIAIQLFSSRLGRRVETETLAPHSHGGGGFTVEYTRRVFRGEKLARDERYRVRYGVAAGVRGGH